MPPSKRRKASQDHNAAQEQAGCRVTSTSTVMTCCEVSINENDSDCNNGIRQVGIADGLTESTRLKVVCAGNEEPKDNESVGQSASLVKQEQIASSVGTQNHASGETNVANTGSSEKSEDVCSNVEVKIPLTTCQPALIPDRRKRHPSKSDGGEVSQVYPLKIVTTVGTAKRTSSRIVKKTRRDFSPPLSPVKKVPHSVEGKNSTPETKTKRNWDLWTDYDKKNFFEGVAEHGKDFEAICHMMQMKCKKRGITGTAIKNKDQVRFFYYRTWNKISKFISVQGDVKKEIIELYGLINYGLLRETIKLKRLDTKTAFKLNELIESGSTTYRIKGKNRKIRTPACTALKKLNNIQDSKEEQKNGIPNKVVVELVPRTNTAWSHVQSLSHNPRLKMTLSSGRSLSTVIEYINKKWTAHLLNHNEEMNVIEVGQELKLFPRNTTAIPVSLSPQFVPPVDITFANFRENVLNSPASVYSKSRKSQESQVHKPSSDNSSESELVPNASPKNVKHCKDKTQPEKTESVQIKQSPSVTPFLQDENAMFPDSPLCSQVTMEDGNVKNVKSEQTEVDIGKKETNDNKTDVAQAVEQTGESVDDLKDNPPPGSKTDDIIKMASEGFTFDNTKNVTLAELLLMFGTLSNGHIKLEYEWCHTNIDVKLSQLANMLRRLSQMAAMEFSEISRLKSNGQPREKSCVLCGTSKHKTQNQQTQTLNSAKSKPSKSDQETHANAASGNIPTVVRLPPGVSRVLAGSSKQVSNAAGDGVFRVPLGIPLMRYPATSQNMSVNLSQVMNSLHPKQSNVLMPRNRRRPLKRQVIVQRTLLPKVPSGGIYEVLPANPASQEAVQANQNSTILSQPYSVTPCSSVLDPSQSASIISNYSIRPRSVDQVAVVSLSQPLTVDTGQTNSIISAAAIASGLSPIVTIKDDIMLTSSVSSALTCYTSVVPSSSVISTPVPSLSTEPSISPPNLSSFLDISLSCPTNTSDNADKFLDLVNSNTGFSGLLGSSKNLSSGNDDHSRLMTPPHSPGSLQDKVNFNSNDSKFWLNGEGMDISLSSLLVDSPAKKSYTSSTGSSFIPTPLALFSEHSQDSIVAKLDVDSTLQVMMNENSMDYVSKFENLAAHIEGSNFLNKSDHPKTFKMFKSQ